MNLGDPSAGQQAGNPQISGLATRGDEAPKMLSIGLHCRLIGRPGRFKALQRFLDYIETHDRVWVARRVDIAKHWAELHPATINVR